MAEGITFTGGQRSSLRQLTATSAAMAISSLRLATGVKISSGLDGASYFAAKGLRERASDLLNFKDGQFKAISTVKAADTAAAAIGSLIEQAKTLAQTARRTADPAVSRGLAVQFDGVLAQMNAVAKESSIHDSNLVTGRAHQTILRGTTVTGVDDVAVTNLDRDANFLMQVKGDGAVSLDERDKSQLETTLGVTNVRATGFSSTTDGGFSDIVIAITGRSGEDRIVTVSDGRDTVSQTIQYSDLEDGDQHFAASLKSGTRIDLDLNRDRLDTAVGTGNAVSLAVRKRVDLAVAVTEGGSGETITRSGLTDDERLSDGENGFRFGDATYRVRLDQSRINLAASHNGPVFSANYGAASAALVGKPVLSGTTGAGADQTFRLTVASTGLDTAVATSTQLYPNVVAVAQRNQYTTSGLAMGQSSTVTINGSSYTSTAGFGGLTAAQVAGDLSAQLGSSGLQVATGGLPANTFNLIAPTPGTGFSSTVSGGVQQQQLQANVAAVSQVNRAEFTTTVELGETYSITINGQDYTYTAGNGDELDDVLSALAHQITPASGPGGDPAVTAAVDGSGINLTAKVAGVPFNQSCSVVNLPTRIEATLSNGTASATENVLLASDQSQVTFSAAFGNGIAGVTLTFDVDRLISAARNDDSLGFDVRFAQQGETGNTTVRRVGREATRGDLRVQFGPASESAYVVQAQNLFNDGLGIDTSANGWRDLADIDKALADCDLAQSRLQSSRSSFAVSLDVLSAWDGFMNGMARVLNEGSDKLVLADQQEEGALLLAEQTRYAIALTSFSVTNRFYASVLRRMLSNGG